MRSQAHLNPLRAEAKQRGCESFTKDYSGAFVRVSSNWNDVVEESADIKEATMIGAVGAGFQL